MEVTDVTEHEDGSATYQWEVTQEEINIYAAIGAKAMMYCAALGISTKDLWKMLDEKVEEHS